MVFGFCSPIIVSLLTFQGEFVAVGSLSLLWGRSRVLEFSHTLCALVLSGSKLSHAWALNVKACLLVSSHFLVFLGMGSTSRLFVGTHT